MSEYYGVTRTPEYLMHYGVRGMRWGVRKAIERGDDARLSKAYQKAVKKLGKLSLNANQGVQKKIYSQAKRNMAVGAISSAGISAGLTAATNHGMSAANKAKYSAIAGLAGGVGGALINSRGIGAGRYASDRGHAKAIAKRDAWRKEMESTFKGTRYGGNAQRKFHSEITRISDASNPKGYVAGQYRKSVNELRRKRPRR